MNIDQYLRRISYAGAPRPDSETLRALHWAHMHTVPFENLDIQLGRQIVLNESDLFEKIVTKRRGGFCYELNGLFAFLLRSIGFGVSLLSARVYEGNESFGPDFDHMALLVDAADSRFLADVGFGDSFLEPLRLDVRDEQLQESATFQIRCEADDESDRYTLMKSKELVNESLQPSFCFSLISREMTDFFDMCRFHQTSEESHFTRKDVCSMATTHGRITISGNELIVTDGDSRSTTTFRNAEEKTLALQQHFGVML